MQNTIPGTGKNHGTPRYGQSEKNDCVLNMIDRMDKNAKIYVAGHHGLVGSAIWKNLQEKGYTTERVVFSPDAGNFLRLRSAVSVSSYR